jgi:hypothetical protein
MTDARRFRELGPWPDLAVPGGGLDTVQIGKANERMQLPPLSPGSPSTARRSASSSPELRDRFGDSQFGTRMLDKFVRHWQGLTWGVGLRENPLISIT